MKFQKSRKDSNVVLKFQFFLVLFLLSSMAGLGQTPRTDTFYAVDLKEQDIEQVVKRILTYYFKPSGKPKVIYLAQEDIQKSWLPSIKNIEFQLLNADEIEQKKINVYLFSEIWQNTPSLYQVVFAYGDPRCKHLGDLWNFRVTKRKVSVWRKQDGQVEGWCSKPTLVVQTF
jgi:hypothetical protein